MYLQLVRESFTPKSTEGKLFVNGTFECYTLEDKDRFLEEGNEKVYGETAIPRGKYTITLTHSNRFGRLLPLLHSVEGFTGVRIHSGNSPEDTEGCILVGTQNNSETDDWIGSSKVAMRALMTKLMDAQQREEIITIEIV